MVNVALPLSIVAAGLLAAGFYLVFRFSTERKNLYRLYVIVFLSAWSALLWHRTYEPTAGLLTVSGAIFAALWGMAFIKRRPPRNRRETKRLLAQVEGEKQIDKFFVSFGNRLFWPTLAVLLLSVCYRLISFFGFGRL